QPVRQQVIDLQGAVLQKLRRQRGRVGDGYNLIVTAMQNERGHGDALQILGEVGFRERLDAVVMCLRASRHALAPPVPDHGLRWLRARAVVAVEGAAREIEIEPWAAR